MNRRDFAKTALAAFAGTMLPAPIKPAALDSNLICEQFELHIDNAMPARCCTMVLLMRDGKIIEAGMKREDVERLLLRALGGSAETVANGTVYTHTYRLVKS